MSAFDFNCFVKDRFERNNTGGRGLDIALDPTTVSTEARAEIAQIVNSIDSTSTKALLLRAVTLHAGDTGRIVAGTCERLAGEVLPFVNGWPWDWKDSLMKVRKDIRNAIEAIGLRMVQCLLIDAALTYHDVAIIVLASADAQSPQLHDALIQIEHQFEFCVYHIHESPLDEQDDIPSSVASIIQSSLVSIMSAVTSRVQWETKRNALIAFQELTGKIAEKVDIRQGWEGTMMVWLKIVTATMSEEDRLRYVYEGFYADLRHLTSLASPEKADSILEPFTEVLWGNRNQAVTSIPKVNSAGIVPTAPRSMRSVAKFKPRDTGAPSGRMSLRKTIAVIVQKELAAAQKREVSSARAVRRTSGAAQRRRNALRLRESQGAPIVQSRGAPSVNSYGTIKGDLFSRITDPRIHDSDGSRSVSSMNTSRRSVSSREKPRAPPSLASRVSGLPSSYTEPTEPKIEYEIEPGHEW